MVTTIKKAGRMTLAQPHVNGYKNSLLPKEIGLLYLDSETADVHFVIGESKVPAHKIFFAARSDVFRAMFYGDLREKGNITIDPELASEDAFKEFLQFFYLNEVNLTLENIWDVLELAKMYMITVLMNMCEVFLSEMVAGDNVCLIYNVAIHFDFIDLKKTCELEIASNTEAVFRSSNFLKCDHSMLRRILKFEQLCCREVTVFNACIAWIKDKCERKAITREMIQLHLGDLFYEIRFGLMTLDEFVHLTPSYGKLFSLDEYQEIVQTIASKKYHPKIFKRFRYPSKCDGNAFLGSIRCVRFNSEILRPIERISFSTNKPILLGGIELMAINGNDSIPTEMSIMRTCQLGTVQILHSQNTTISCKLSQLVALNKLIKVEPGFRYSITFKQQSKRFAVETRNELKLPGSNVVIKFDECSPGGELVTRLRFNHI